MKLPKNSLKKRFGKQKGFSSSVLLIILIIVILALVSFFFFSANAAFFSQPKTNLTNQTEFEEKTPLSTELKENLETKLLLVERLSQNMILARNVAAANLQNSNLTQQQIAQLDEQWSAAGNETVFVKSFLTNETAQLLISFQEAHPEFAEIFVTDKVGLNVGQTNKTTDYYQADEQWWTDVFNSGVGKSYYGEIEYDESAKSESIALYVPIYDAQKQVVGVIKAVLSLSALQREL